MQRKEYDELPDFVQEEMKKTGNTAGYAEEYETHFVLCKENGERYQPVMKDPNRRFGPETVEETMPQVGSMVVDEDGRQYKVADREVMATHFRAEWPEGMTIYLEGETFQWLLDMKERVELGNEHLLEPCVLRGQVMKDDEMLHAWGPLDAELRLPPEMYGRLYANEEKYGIYGPEPDRMDGEDRAATALLDEHQADLKGAEVEIPIREDILPYIYIEGRPLAEVYNTAERTQLYNDEELKLILNVQNLFEKGLPKDGRLPDILKNNFVFTLDGDSLYEGRTPEECRRVDHMVHLRTEAMLKSVSLLSSGPVNLLVEFSPGKERTARMCAGAANRLYTEDLFAYPEGNRVEVSISNASPHLQQEIKQLFAVEPDFHSVTELPYRNLAVSHSVFLLLDNGDMLRGHVDVPGRHENRYGYDISGGELAPLDYREDRSIFSTMDVPSSLSQGQTGYRVVGRFDMADAEALHIVGDVTVTASETTDGIRKIQVPIKGEGTLTSPVTPEDAALYDRYMNSKMPDDKRQVLTAMLAMKYFGGQIDRAWKQEQAQHGQGSVAEDRTVRITAARLYGNVDNIKVRCCIDGRQQIGRPLAPGFEDQVKQLRKTAADLGKSTLNYGNFLHESIIRQMAAATFDDVLRDQSQQQTRGRTR